MTGLEQRLRSVEERIAEAALRAGRDPAAVRLVAVTKTLPAEMVGSAYALGLRHFGENRIEEAAAKVAALPDDAVWHMIGHVQGRKARQVVQLMHWVHSVDSVRLAARLDRLCENRPAPLRILLEMNVSGEASKDGFPAWAWTTDPYERRVLFQSVGQVLALPHLRVEGLMTIAPIVPQAEQVRPIFAGLRALRDALRDHFPGAGWDHLSMGMTGDFEVAVEEGATMVRIGRAIFAPGP